MTNFTTLRSLKPDNVQIKSSFKQNYRKAKALFKIPKVNKNVYWANHERFLKPISDEPETDYTAFDDIFEVRFAIKDVWRDCSRRTQKMLMDFWESERLPQKHGNN